MKNTTVTKIVNDILDQIMEEYLINNKIIFQNESLRAKHHYAIIDKQLNYWRQSKECMVPNCTNRSILKSHTIPKSMSLSQINENGLLLTPVFNQGKGVLRLESRGISQASVFPGFCHDHERLFEGFETKKKIESEDHIALQTYRAACRELFRLKFLLKQKNEMLTTYCHLREEGLLRLFNKKAIEFGLNIDTNSICLSLKDDPTLKSNDIIRGVEDQYQHIKNNILPALEGAIFHTGDSNLFIAELKIDLKVPVALSGCASYYVNDNSVKKSIYLMMNVIPCADHTLIIFAGDIADKNYIDCYISSWTANSFSIISMIESWMINGTDQWYLNPNVWNLIPFKRKTAIINAITNCEQNIGEECGLSIFDFIRLSMINAWKEKEEPTQDEQYWKLIQAQKDKML